MPEKWFTREHLALWLRSTSKAEGYGTSAELLETALALYDEVEKLKRLLLEIDIASPCCPICGASGVWITRKHKEDCELDQLLYREGG